MSSILLFSAERKQKWGLDLRNFYNSGVMEVILNF